MPLPTRSSTTVPRILANVLWPLAIMTVIHRVLIRAVNGAITNDFATVYAATRRFLAGEPVYSENLLTVQPHYLYAPSGTLLLSPFGVIDNYTISRWLFILINTAAIIAALWLLMRMFDLDVKSFAAPAILLAAFSTEAVTNTLVFTNINGVIFLCQAAFLYLLHTRRLWWAGAAIGLSLAVKPMLAPLLVLPLIRKQWQPFVGALVIPAAAMAAGWALTVDAARYLDTTMPYMGQVRDYYNSSIAGLGVYYGVPEPLILVTRILVVAATLLAVWLLLDYRHNNEVLWLATTTGVVLAGVFLVSTLGQMYYSMMLIPLMLTVVLKGSLVRTWPAWLAAYAFFFPDNWESVRWPYYGRVMEFAHPTLGWLLILATILVVLLWRRAAPGRHERIAPAATSA
ncbi:glycosyltransferase family 87 protein [Dietzia aurantiaca]|uniref:Glycosyltransferase family 87 protein n=1 Tax=Dietzia aurantiaca TaxID=983873 RepID=A0ABV9PU11_9ACTN